MVTCRQLVWAGALLILMAGAPARAQDAGREAGKEAGKEAEKLAAQIPPEITEVVTGGTWSEGGAEGVFRGIVVTSPAGEGAGQASVIVQWLAMAKGGATGKVVKSVTVKEVTEKKLQNAFLALDVDNDNELTLIITSYDAQKDEDASMQVKFDSKGQYEIIPTPKEDPAVKEEEPASDDASGGEAGTDSGASDPNKKK
jgi:hypothetical protein